jgi:hypothetical protein
MKYDIGRQIPDVRTGGRVRALYVSCMLVAGLTYPVAVAIAQQTVPRLIHFAGLFHPPANQPAGPVGATFAIFPSGLSSHN